MRKIIVLNWFFMVAADGFHGYYLLIYALLIWLVFLIVLLFNRHSRLNFWCFIAGMILGTGAFKEFLFYELGPVLVAQNIWSLAFSEELYSILSAVFYYTSMPSMLIFGLYFSHMEIEKPALFPSKAYLCYLPAVVMAVVFPAHRTLQYQSTQIFCLSVAAYNWLYGILLTVLLIRTLHQEVMTDHYHQDALVAVSVLFPIWCWLILAFPYHAIGISRISKVWQFNLPAIIFILLFLLYHAFRGGIWGVRFKREVYDWSTGEKVLRNNIHYISHALKNDISKINWCLELLKQKGIQEKELDIIQNSTDHLELFLQSTQLYSNRIVLNRQMCDMQKLFQQLCEEFVPPSDKMIQLLVLECDLDYLYCDSMHLREVLHNLISNAAEASNKKGIIQLSYRCQASNRRAVISVTDQGQGIDNRNIKHLTEPFYTTKNTNNNMGLGLYYCRHVMEAHKGRIQVQSEIGKGSTFSLYFPLNNIGRREKRSYEKNKGNSC